MTLGGASVKLYVDTGSSNLWLIDKQFQCIDVNGNPVDNAECHFVATDFDPSSASGSRIEPSFFNTGYSGGEYMIGYGWTSDVEFLGVTLKDQVFGVAHTAHWAGDSLTSGLIGLGSLYTNQIYRNDSSSPTPGDDNRLVFPNPITLAWEQGLSSECEWHCDPERAATGPDATDHSLALNRVPFDAEHNGVQPAGFLSLGGRPAEVAVSGKQVTIPCIKWTVGASGGLINEQAWSAYDAHATFVFPGSDQVQQNEVTLQMDTGSSGVGLPSPVYNAYQALIASTACDGSGLPGLAVRIAGVDLAFDKRDMLGYDPGTDTCFWNAYDSGADMAAL